MAMIDTKGYCICIGTDEADYPMKLSYEIAKEEKGYGVRIIKTMVDVEGIERIEKKTAFGILNSERDAEDFLNFLYERKVTPMTLEEAALEFVKRKILII